MPGLTSDMVLGVDFLQQNHCQLDLDNGIVQIKSDPAPEQPQSGSPLGILGSTSDINPKEERKLKQFLTKELPPVVNIRKITPLIKHDI